MHKYYKHFKGNLYKLLFIAKDSETLKQGVVYQAMYGKEEIWTRDYDNFFSTVTVDGVEVPRFQEIEQKQ